jgi:hypothetical protein
MLSIKTLKLRPIAWKGAYLFLCAFLLMGFQAVIFAGANQQKPTSGSPAYDAVSNENARIY